VVYSNGGTWYPVACISVGLEHRLHLEIIFGQNKDTVWFDTCKFEAMPYHHGMIAESMYP